MKMKSCLLLSVAVICMAMNIRVFGQTFQVIHTFTGMDGDAPLAGLTLDRAGNLYGTTFHGALGNGVAFKMSHHGSGWVFNPLYIFHGGDDGAFPTARLIFGPDGTLFGTTSSGDGICGGEGCGRVFNLGPPATFCRTVLCFWRETVIHNFTGFDGSDPMAEITFDQSGSAYGSAAQGGAHGVGVIYELVQSGGGWTESILYSFNVIDGLSPQSPLTLDASGNLYGTTNGGGDLSCGTIGCGTVFKLTPSGSGWTLITLHVFTDQNDGGYPQGGLILDQAGNLYGTAPFGGVHSGGVAFEVAPSGTLSVIYSFAAGATPYAGLTSDAAGNLYGTTALGGAFGRGSVYKLTSGNGTWTYTSLHDFSGGSDGSGPQGVVTIDGAGNLYGTAAAGGSACAPNGCGVVWEITP